MQNPAPPPAAAAASLEETAFAAVGVAQRVVELLLAGCGGERQARELACVERVCTSLTRAALPQWRVLCWRANASVAGELEAELAAELGATGGAGNATPAVGVRCRWRSLGRQLLRSKRARPLLHRCEDVRFHVDVRFRGALLFARCLGPFAGAEHLLHFLSATHDGALPHGAAPPHITAGDVYDAPQQFTATLHAQRRSDGAMATLPLSLMPDEPSFLPFSRDVRQNAAEQRALRRLGSDETSIVLLFHGELPCVVEVGDGGVNTWPFCLHLHLQAEDAALTPAAVAIGGAATRAEPLFFQAPGFYVTELAQWETFRDADGAAGWRAPLWRGGSDDSPRMGLPYDSRPRPAPIPEAHLARPLVLRRDTLCVLLCFSSMLCYTLDGVVDADGDVMDCKALRSSLDVLVWELP
jgi:hypothetical protein